MDNLYDPERVWKNPKSTCSHGKVFFCQRCWESWPEERKKMMEGVKACSAVDTEKK